MKETKVKHATKNEFPEQMKSDGNYNSKMWHINFPS